MKIVILSVEGNSYSTSRLKAAAEQRGYAVKVVDTLKTTIDLQQGSPDLYYEGDPLEGIDAVIPRIAPSITYYGVAVVRQFEQMGVFCANSSSGIQNSRDKLRSLQILSRGEHGIGIPQTTFVRDKNDTQAAIERVGGVPVVIKLIEGTQGIGVILAEHKETALAITEALKSVHQNILIQKFVEESRGRDIRAFVVGDRVVAAMRRTAVGNEFRSNVARGGVAEAIELDPLYAQTAIRATQIMGLRIAGVDMLEGKDGPLVMEINSSPGLQGIEEASKVDVAGAVIDYIATHHRFPDVDIRQRLTVPPGYGVADLMIREASPYAGKTIAESRLRERDINILTLRQNGQLIANPRSSRILQGGDALLCFGKLEAMREHTIDRAPPRVRKPRKHDLPPSLPPLPSSEADS
ncbi:MAG: RimK family alpha-L-glutamate ligase [Planctomycetota bacterium]|nr:MAG: RimK family alpha-L-glutamate ligase [Planctomycetota bacterium]